MGPAGSAYRELTLSSICSNEITAFGGRKIVNESRKSLQIQKTYEAHWPRKHTLTKVDTTGSFDVVAKTHKRRGFFFSDELKERGVVGEFAGATRTWKLNTYGLTWDQIKYTSDAFLNIASKYGLNVS
jgi:Cys-tRNA synthase (O-phospho-L-seryl-tRNA:Cys-tRNA synthase)